MVYSLMITYNNKTNMTSLTISKPTSIDVPKVVPYRGTQLLVLTVSAEHLIAMAIELED